MDHVVLAEAGRREETSSGHGGSMPVEVGVRGRRRAVATSVCLERLWCCAAAVVSLQRNIALLFINN